VYGGLAGLLIVSDNEEAALPLPAGRRDLALVIQDRTFDPNNQLVYMPGGMMDRMNGAWGDRILVNGRSDASMDVDAGAYRLRILNGSNARIYRLAWDDGTPLTIIGTDGGLLERPEEKQNVLLAPGERIELWADFSRYSEGSAIRLVSRPLPQAAAGGMTGGMMGRGRMGRMMGRRALPQHTTFSVIRFKVGAGVGTQADLPERLTRLERYMRADADNRSDPRRFSLAMSHMQGVINGRTFAMEAVAPDEAVRLGATEIWEFANNVTGMGMMNMPMAHPMHIHAVQFQVLERRGRASDGHLDRGWKDTVLVLPGERVRVMARFAPFEGLYLYHCHNLEHEDGGMMRNFRIIA
jgi:FtsP/CotA-like multicopper oxidase with cupredoxin domain